MDDSRTIWQTRGLIRGLFATGWHHCTNFLVFPSSCAVRIVCTVSQRTLFHIHEFHVDCYCCCRFAKTSYTHSTQHEHCCPRIMYAYNSLVHSQKGAKVPVHSGKTWNSSLNGSGWMCLLVGSVCSNPTDSKTDSVALVEQVHALHRRPQPYIPAKFHQNRS